MMAHPFRSLTDNNQKNQPSSSNVCAISHNATVIEPVVLLCRRNPRQPDNLMYDRLMILQQLYRGGGGGLMALAGSNICTRGH